MNVTSKVGAITFPVDSVTPADTAMPVHNTGEALKKLIASSTYTQPKPKLVSWSQYNSKCIQGASYHPLIYAVHAAFSEHRPLILSPDMIWITIVQGLAQHVRNNAEAMRHLFVAHKGKREIAVERDDVFLESPETAWDEIISQFSQAVGDTIGEAHNQLLSNFSTTGDLERIACEVALLDMFEPYFDYNLYCSCGIPTITLEGVPSDWSLLREKIELLDKYNLDWWLPSLRKICDQFERAAKGDIDLPHWQSIYKVQSAYAREDINGWIAKLVPYLRRGMIDPFNLPNSLLAEDCPQTEDLSDQKPHRDTIASTSLPSGVSMVPFTLIEKKKRTGMQFLGGFLGVQQNDETLALRPKLGWAVAYAPLSELFSVPAGNGMQILEPQPLEQYLQQLKRIGAQRPRWYQSEALPNDLANFYRQYGGLVYTDQITGKSACIRPMSEIDLIPNPVSIIKHPPVTTSETDVTYDDATIDIFGEEIIKIVVGELLDSSSIVFEFTGSDPFGTLKLMADQTVKHERKDTTFTELLKAFVEGKGLMPDWIYQPALPRKGRK